MHIDPRGTRVRPVTPLLMIVASSLSVPSHAQDDAVLERVTVTAQRREENIQDVPISVVVMDQEALSRSQVNTLVDLPQVAPSLNFENRGIGSALSFSMRGIGAFAPYITVQPGVGLVVDEVPFTRNVEYDLELGGVSSVQFLNGPQGTLFGANNIGGAVLVTTPDPGSVFEGSAEGTVTTDDEYIMRAMVSGPVTDRIGARLSVYTREREGYITNLYPLADVSGADRRGGEESQGARLKLNFDLADSVNLKLTGDYRHTYSTDTMQLTDLGGSTDFATLQGNGDPVLGLRVVNDPKLTNSDSPNYTLTDAWGVSANLTWGLTDTITLKSISAYRETEQRGVIDFDVSPATAGNPQGAVAIQVLRSNRGLHAEDDGRINSICNCDALENFKQELRLQYSNEMFDAVVGGYYFTEDHVQPVEAGATGGAVAMRTAPVPLLQFFNMFDNEIKLQSSAAFVDATWHLSDALDLFAGYRWTEEKLDLDFYTRNLVVPAGGWTVVGDTVFVDPAYAGTVTAFKTDYDTGEWAGRAGFMWKMIPDVNLYGSVSRGFTGAGVVITATSPANAFVSPTTAVSYEVGVKSSLLGNRVRLNVALFQNELEDIQSSLFNTATLQNMLVNAGDFRSQGVELDLTALLGERLTLNATATLMDTELTSDVFEPCYFGQTPAQGCVNTGRLDAFGRPVFAQNVKGKPGINAPDLKYTLGAAYDLPFSSLPFDGRAAISYNWTDERYYELTFDPVASLAPSYGTLDLNLALVDKQGRYNISLFGKNVLDERFVTFASSDVGRNGRARAAYSRASFAYWGVSAKFNF